MHVCEQLQNVGSRHSKEAMAQAGLCRRPGGSTCEARHLDISHRKTCKGEWWTLTLSSMSGSTKSWHLLIADCQNRSLQRILWERLRKQLRKFHACRTKCQIAAWTMWELQASTTRKRYRDGIGQKAGCEFQQRSKMESIELFVAWKALSVVTLNLVGSSYRSQQSRHKPKLSNAWGWHEACNKSKCSRYSEPQDKA